MLSKRLIVAGFIASSTFACGGNEQTPEAKKSTGEMWALTNQLNALRQAKSPFDGLTLDVRDELQKNFVDKRLRFMGKTPENSPNLFARLEKNSSREVATGVAALGPTANADVGVAADCSSPLSVEQNPDDPTRWVARIITSCFAGADYSYVDLFWWNSATGDILAYDFAEEFTEAAEDLVLDIEAEAADIGVTLQVDSMTINARGAEDLYFFDGLIQERPDAVAARDTITHPRDSNADGTVISCLDRGGLDCDYFFAGTGGNVTLPVSMAFRFPGVVTNILNATAQVHMTDNGGVCKTNDLSPYTTAAAGVVTINTGATPATFGTRCVYNQTNVRFWVKLVVANSRGDVYSMFWANDRPTDPRRFHLMFRWSCLAEGSSIVMADGSKKSIENIKLGDAVRSGVEGGALQVVDITKGTESAPMVEVTDTLGRKVMVTEGHPFFDDSGFAIRADSLRAGHRVETAEGLTSIARVDRIPYGGKVYNLKLGTDEQAAANDVSKTHMFANGYRVGDSRSQWALELKLREIAVNGAPKAEWTSDYLARKLTNEL